jgi:cytochrome c biogenesis protein CcmG/thiol:disulfide interchange protein DsbE
MRYLIPLILFLIITGFLWKGLQHDPHELPSALINKPVAAFSYPNLLDEKKPLTQKEFLGHVSLLNVWATWCVSCKAEHAVLMDIMRAKAVKIYGLNYKDDPNSARAWLKKYGNPYEAIISDEKGTLAIDFGVYGTPETFVIDGEGIIRYKYIGPISPDAWKDKVEPEVQKWSTKSS